MAQTIAKWWFGLRHGDIAVLDLRFPDFMGTGCLAALGNTMLSCRRGWGGVGVMITFLFFAHMVDATLLAVFLLVLTCLLLR